MAVFLLAFVPARGADRAPAPSTDGGGASLAKTELPAKGRGATILSVARFGRYAILARSAQGTALQLVDRMSGPGEIAGDAGSRDGRLDLFLDRGDYEVETFSSEKGSGAVSLAVRPSVERNPAPAAVLVEGKPVESSLSDFEQRSWWIDVKERRTVALEAAGRNLADLRLWQNGSWLVDAAPSTEVITPLPGEPLLDCRLAATLEPGLYRATAYGGPAQDWAHDSPERPLHLRYGIPVLAEAGRRRFTASPFGVDRFVVPGAANFFRLELPEAREASIRVSAGSAERPFEEGGAAREIHKNSVPPAAELETAPQPEGFQTVVIRTEAGRPYVLQQFEAKNLYRFAGDGRYWISTISAGDPADSIDATAFLFRLPGSEAAPAHIEPLLSSAAPLSRRTGWRRKFNLLRRASLFFDVADGGAYEVLLSGAAARCRIEPFLLSPPENYRAPEFRRGLSKWELEKGFAVLTVDPVKKGIVEVVVRAAGAESDLGTSAAPPRRAAAIFPDVPLKAGDSYTVFVNDQPEVRSGLVVRPLPLDLTRALPISVSSGQTIDAPFETKEPGSVHVDAEDGEPLPFSIDGNPAAGAAVVAPGTRTLTIRNAAGNVRLASASFVPARLSADAPLPPLPEESLATLPKFPVLDEKAPAAFDLAGEEHATFLLRADAPSLYRVETTGLLATAGSLRTRTNPSFRRESENGVGRNFLIEDYLREGDYQVTVAPVGASRGHAAIAVTRTPLEDGGRLSDRVPARATLAAGHAIAYRFSVPKRAEYRVRAIGLGHTFRCRLETSDGWPIAAPAAEADVTRIFEPGEYRLVILPEPLPSRVVAVLARRLVPRRRSGHGPHFLPLARTVSYEWRESEPRTPDRWEFTLPAEAEVSIAVTDEMTAALSAAGGAGGPLATVATAAPWKGRLAAGKYRLDAVCARVNDRVRYRISVAPTELLSGLDREITAPATIPLSVGREGLVRLSSFGTADLRATLRDASGRVLAGDDDRPDDWNFEIATRLAPGRYALAVDPVGSEAAASTVSMEMPREIAEPALASAQRKTFRPGRSVHVFPLERPAAESLLLVSAASRDGLGIAVDTRKRDAWREIAAGAGGGGPIAIPVEAGEELRLRVWSIDRRGNPADLSAAFAAPPPISEARLASGDAEASAAPGFSPATAVARVALERPGTFRVGDPEGLLWSAGLEHAATPAREVIEATGDRLWLVRPIAGGSASAPFGARRVRLAAGDELAVAGGEKSTIVDLERHAGPIVAIASALSGSPVVTIGTGGPGNAPADAAISDAGSLAVSLSGEDRIAAVRSAEPDGRPIDVRLRTIAYAPPRREIALAASGGTWDGEVGERAALAFELPPGRKTVRLALGGGLAAAISSGAAVESAAWASGDPSEEEFVTEGDRVTILATGAPAKASITVLPAAGNGAAIRAGAPLEENAIRRSALHRTVEGGTGATLRVRGNAAEAIYLSPSGRLLRGTDLPLEPGLGALSIVHAPGPLRCWVETSAGGEWAGPAVEPVDLAAPGTVALEGSARAFRFAPGKEIRLLHLRSGSPAVVRISSDGREETDAFPDGVDVDLPIGETPATVALRGFAGAPLSGSLEVEATPVAAAREGLGPATLVPPGGARGFAFRVPEKQEIGVGVRSSSEAIDAALIGPSGARIGSGIVQMPTLDPGRYVLVVRAPRGSEPVLVRPAIAGLERPGTGPPPEVIRRYLHPEEAATPALPPGEPPAPAGEEDLAPGEEPPSAGVAAGENEDEESAEPESALPAATDESAPPPADEPPPPASRFR